MPHFVLESTTRWSDEDRQGVLNNAVYLTLFEEARLGFVRQAEVLNEGSFPFLLAESTVRYLRPGRGGAHVTVELSTTKVGRSSFHQAYRVRDVNTRDVWAEGVAVLVCYDPKTMRSTPMSGELREALEALR